MQKTISRPISCYGIATHSGRTVHLILEPAPANTGIVFMRTDVSSLDNIILARYDNVIDTDMATTIGNTANVRVSTIEHLMAALHGCNIDNILVKINGPEVPIMDGSSKAFLWMIECAGIVAQNAKKMSVKILRDVYASSGHSDAFVAPGHQFEVDMHISFSSKVIGSQSFKFNHTIDFKQDISSARTFGFIKDLNMLKNKGLALGASLENAIGIDGDEVLNAEGLRYEDEFVRHKLLDAIGDFYTSGGEILGNFTCNKSGHMINNLLLRYVFENKNNYSISS